MKSQFSTGAVHEVGGFDPHGEVRICVVLLLEIHQKRFIENEYFEIEATLTFRANSSASVSTVGMVQMTFNEVANRQGLGDSQIINVDTTTTQTINCGITWIVGDASDSFISMQAHVDYVGHA